MTESAAPPTGSGQPDDKVLRPRDAATLMIIDQSVGEPRILLGKRRMDVAFMAGKYVFPGGRVDRSDHGVTAADELPAREIRKLLHEMKGAVSTSRARALALAAIRETFEEAGLIIGKPLTDASKTPAASGPWSAFFAHGFAPALGSLTFFARAITPPGRSRRFDARFFAVDASAIAKRVEITDGELSGLDWMPIEAARRLDLPNITRVVLEDLGDSLAAGPASPRAAQATYYYQRNGSFRRDVIA
jgi:8-oxo-dGTP pyrophosphatase MutT (NUDIX family)